ncbi:hypothetical protein D3C83_56010 [compost metagenome]
MPALRVLNRKVVQVELGLQGLNLARFGVLDGDPDETSRPATCRANLANRDVAQPAAIFVRNATDQHRVA